MKDENFLKALTGSFSSPSADNPTVEMMEADYRSQKLHARYINCEVTKDNLKAAVEGAKAMGWVGFNCSTPHKVAIIDLIDEIGESASIIGAVNCVTIRDGKMTGDNSDGKGFLLSLKKITDPTDKKIALLGAGGAARAVAVELALAGATEITVINRNAERGEALAKLVNEKTPAQAKFTLWQGDYQLPDDIDILVNATSIGLGDEKALPPVNIDSIKEGLIVADVIPNPPKTAFLKAAAEKKAKTLDGLGMLVNQGAVAIKLWFNIEAETQVMEDRLFDIFGA
ncbi:MAG: shikimate dehydrogenase [Zymomonas mobilis subsp. pomaceae]|uniref:Shikimate dehydrogenase (NADP(+)) n=1 Tax=Zymomonas mobilis subsp. pomaceae (strain ATCC 29192 / DSM 22645 / JCM 10191 / CCUG 17912 / NBRC 13757 / NCIMB 11200 / NRRL B-4491 / Barker I) TaxID=579138 RepID=F8ESM7_ZYMMT|nr:shikimate dehydrogenase [Zymomonas mobilis]AEI37802.1 shikimate 5-dehydrogenase [Zymomonas mobilis subsp. pomaceae ATCC 29192]MDX5949169.1 shikimate dehydrogenase [Zymomonas mobilis subsp. pomaceae]GEB89805.1 shikimate dehydrogenase (NADP(+)) [Zymomonas mobilis subsp. pomaceae]